MLNNYSVAPLPVIPLDPSSSVPLYGQIYQALRSMILSGRWAAGTKFPSTRAMAAGLMVSRNTIMNAYDQLLAEGFLEGHAGSGTYIPRSLPDDLVPVRFSLRKSVRLSEKGRSFSLRGMLATTTPVNASRDPSKIRPFWPGIPALREFPLGIWSRLMARHLNDSCHNLLGYGDPAGYWPLREAIANYLVAARGVQCTTEQVIITSGRQQAFDLAVRVLMDPGDAAWIEDPGYIGARAALLGSGAKLVPIPMDSEGIDVAVGQQRCPGARLAMVSPSHQYPIGVTMSLARRLALLEWAKAASAWILEDDYDSEYRYTGRPFSALQGLDQEGRVIYIGTFSKVMFPSLRVGYLVVPSDKVTSYVTARALLSRFSPLIDQAVLSDFIREGHFARHLRRMRVLYRERQKILIAELERELPGIVEVQPDQAGLHLVGWLPEGTNAAAVSCRAATYGVDAQPLSAFCLERQTRPALVLGYAGYDEDEIRKGVQQLALALRDLNLRQQHAVITTTNHTKSLTA